MKNSNLKFFQEELYLVEWNKRLKCSYSVFITLKIVILSIKQNIATNSERDSIACLATCMKDKARKEIKHSSIRTQRSWLLANCLFVERAIYILTKTLQVHLQQNGNIIPKMCLFQSFSILRMLVIANFLNSKVMLMKC